MPVTKKKTKRSPAKSRASKKTAKRSPSKKTTKRSPAKKSTKRSPRKSTKVSPRLPLEKNTIPELKEKCRARGIRGYSYLKKAQLINALRGKRVVIPKSPKKKCPSGTHRSKTVPRRCVKGTAKKCSPGTYRHAMTGRCRKTGPSEYQKFFGKRIRELHASDPDLPIWGLAGQVAEDWRASPMYKKIEKKVTRKRTPVEEVPVEEEEFEEIEEVPQVVAPKLASLRPKLAHAAPKALSGLSKLNLAGPIIPRRAGSAVRAPTGGARLTRADFKLPSNIKLPGEEVTIPLEPAKPRMVKMRENNWLLKNKIIEVPAWEVTKYGNMGYKVLENQG